MGNAPSFADAVIALRAVNPAAWPNEAEFRTSVERIGIGNPATSDRERALKQLIDVAQDLRDEIIEDAANTATKHAVANTQASNVVAAASVVRSVLINEGVVLAGADASAPVGTHVRAHAPTGAHAGTASFDDLFA